MATLFRYIQHDFAIGKAVDAIDVANDSAFQSDLRAAPREPDQRSARRDQARGFLDATYPTATTDATSLGVTYDGFADDLARLEDVTTSSLASLVKARFGEEASAVASSDRVREDRVLLENSIVAVKLATGFSRVDADRLVRQLRIIALIHAISYGPSSWTRADVDAAMGRPIRIDVGLLPPARPRQRASEDRGDGPAARRVGDLRTERDALDVTYRALMTISPRHFEAVQGAAPDVDRDQPPQTPSEPDGAQASSDSVARGRGYIRLGATAVGMLPEAGRAFFERQGLAAEHASLEDLVDSVNRRRAAIELELLPYSMPAAQRVYRVGTHLFAANEAPPTKRSGSMSPGSRTNPGGLGDADSELVTHGR